MKHLKLFFALFAMLALGVGNAWAESETMATWTFSSSSYPKNKTNYEATSGTCKTGSTFYLNGTGSQWHNTKGYAFTAVTDITITIKLSKAISAGTPLTFSADMFYNNSSNAPMTGFDLSVSEKGSAYSTTGLSATSISLSNSSANKAVKYTTQNALDKDATIQLKYTGKGKAGAGQGYFGNIKVTAEIAAASCDKKVTLTKGSESNGTFTLDKVNGSYDNCDDDFVVKVSNVVPISSSQYCSGIDVTGGYSTVTGPVDGVWTVTYAKGNSITSTITPTFADKTPATVTLYEAGQEKTVEGYVGDSYELPLTSTQTCGTKTFVGWSTEEIATPGDKPTNYFYEPETTITLAAEQTFYAVYATSSGTPETWEQTTSVAVGDQVIIAQVDNGTKEMTGLGKTPETANNNYGVGTDFTTNPNGTLIWTVEEGNAPGQFSFNNGTYYLNLGANENYLSYSATKTATSSWTVSTSDERAVVTNANYDSRKIMWNKNNTRFASYSKNHGENSGQYYYHIVFYKKSGGISYSDYTTSCGTTPEPAVLVSIAANAEDKNEFTEGDEFVKAIITATYDDATTKDVTEDATFTGYDMSTPGTQTVTVTYEDKTTTYTITVTARPAATLTLSKNGDTETFPGEYKVGDVINLPTFTSDCSKTFVGWDPKSDCAGAPKYAPGAEYTLAAETQTLYAVYANAIEGALVNVFSETFDACEGSGGNDGKWSGSIASGTLSLTDWELIKGSPADGCAKFGTGSVKGSAETPAIALTGNATLTFRAGAWNGSSEKTTLNLSAIGATLSQTSVTLAKGAWTEYTIYLTEATGSVKIKFEASFEEYNRFFLDDVVVSQASVTYSKYSTTCTEALDAPTFNPAAGTYNEVTYVTISATDTDVYYTLDGSTPTKESNKYTAPIVLNTNGTTTIKAIAISGESQSSVVTATYTIKLPLTTMDEIFAAATTAGGAEAPVLITMNNWVVSAVKEDGKTAYLTDGTKGLIIYTASHGFNVGDILSGTVACNVQLFKGSAELTGLTATTEGLSRTTGGTVSTVVVDDVTTLSGVNTGSVIKINGVHESDNIVNNVKLYNTLFSFENLTPGQEYNVTGVYLQYDATKEILPRSAADIEEVVGLPTATISIENITLVEGDKHTIVATITPDEAASKVTYSIKNGNEYISLSGNVITANAVGTATITAAIAEVDGVYHGTTKDFTVTVNEYVAPISGTWKLVTDASTLKAGMEVIVAQYVEADGTIYTMGAQKTNNRDVVESSVLGETLTPTTGTAVLTLVDAGNGTFALQADNDKYLYAASNTSNHLKETATINDNAKWSISVTEGKASVVAQGDNSRNTIRFNKSNTPKIFSCYEGGQTDIALYALVPDHIREVPVGYFATICVPNNIVKVVGATLYKVAGKENGKLYFDEVLVEETVEGMPYVFFTELETQEFYFGTKTTSTAGKEKSLKGTFVKLEDEDLQGHYMLQSNKIIKCADTGCWIDPNRAYFDGNDLSTLSKPSAQMPGRRRVSMGAEEENETTGTENIVAPEGQTLKLIENGQLIIIRNGEKYNVQGIKL